MSTASISLFMKRQPVMRGGGHKLAAQVSRYRTPLFLNARARVFLPHGRVNETSAGHHRSALETRRLVLVGVISAVIGGVVSVLVFARLSDPSRLHLLAEVRQQQLAQQDADNLNRIGLALNQYAVDHNGNYPTSLDELGPTYLESQLYNQGSNPAQPYAYDYPAVDKDWGSFDLIDNGSLEPSQLKLSNGIGGPLCRPMTCKYIIYTESAGLIGLPTAAATPKPAASASASKAKQDLSTTEYGKFRD